MIAIIIALISILILFLILVRSSMQIERFTAIPDMRVPAGSPEAGKQSEELNVCWRSILNYLSKNPEKALPLIQDMRDKFFEPSCQLKQPSIPFNQLADTYQPIFSD
jgi:hypothetical protein